MDILYLERSSQAFHRRLISVDFQGLEKVLLIRRTCLTNVSDEPTSLAPTLHNYVGALKRVMFHETVFRCGRSESAPDVANR